MIRLCIDARMMHSSGIGTCIRNLLPFLCKPPFDVSLLVKENFRSPIYSISEQFFFPWKVPPCDVFWSPHYNTPVLPIRSRARVATIHDVCHLALPQFLSKGKRVVAKWLLQNACKKSQKVVTDSEFSKSEIMKYLRCSPEQIEVIYPGVNVEEFRPSAKVEGDPFFLFVGNFKAHKNISVLFKAFEMLKHPTCRLVLVGKQFGPISVGERVVLLGEVSNKELVRLYVSATALVFPSLYEGFGLPPLEAMACGCPVLASKAASIPEVCSDAAAFFPPESPHELMQCMKQVLEEEFSNDLTIKGLDRVKSFSWKSAADKYRTLFEKVAAL